MSPSTLPEGRPLVGYYSQEQRLFMVSNGSPDLIKNTPLPSSQHSSAINTDVKIPRFRHPRYLSLEFAYLAFIPRHNPFHHPLFRTLDRPRHKIPIMFEPNRGYRLHPDVAEEWLNLEHSLRAVGTAMIRIAPRRHLWRLISPWFFPGRFKFMHVFPTERAARFAAQDSAENFLPLLGYLAMGFWYMSMWEVEAEEAHEPVPDWRVIVADKTKVHPAFLDYVEQSVLGDGWLTENAKKGIVGKKGHIFVWKKTDGYYIREPALRCDFDNLFADYPASQRRFDPIHKEWDLCEIFQDGDPIFGEAFEGREDDEEEDYDDDMDYNMNPPTSSQNTAPASRLPEEGTGSAQEQPPQEDGLDDYVPTDAEFGPAVTESEIDDRDTAIASRKCLDIIYVRFGLTPRTTDPVYETITSQLVDALNLRFGFRMPRSAADIGEQGAERVAVKDMGNIVGVGEIEKELSQHQGIADVLGIFFAQCTRARSAQDVDRNLLGPDPHHSHFEIVCELLKSMRDPAESTCYYVLRRRGGTPIGSDILLSPPAADILEVLRQGWGPELRNVVSHLVARGIPFWHACVSAEIMPESSPVAKTGFRPKGFKADAFRQLDADVYDVGDCLWDGASQYSYWHHKLSAHEIDLLCGVYQVATGTVDQITTVSWWPKPSAWARSNIDSWWMPRCEDFFRRRTEQLTRPENPVYMVSNQSKWRNGLKYRPSVQKCWDGYERVAQSIAGRLSVPLKVPPPLVLPNPH
ncbi:hypothetical protein C8R46DRAFT_1038056 [Mycena filopes]|nr:hypothetical protein C8R46DRAFT_1038056 [Mycena filopes]